MTYSMASLLAHEDTVPRAARDALLAAQSGSDDRRRNLLESAARTLHAEVGVSCDDALELVDLPSGSCAE